MSENSQPTYWETEEESGIPQGAWMLLDWNGGIRVVACRGGGLPYEVGEAVDGTVLTACGIDAFIRDRLSAPVADALLVPWNGEAWFVFPQFYLSTGCLLWLRLPMLPRRAVRLAEEGQFGTVEIFPDLPVWPPSETGAPSRAVVRAWKRVCDLLPGQGETCEVDEMIRLLRAVAALHGMRGTVILARSLREQDGDVQKAPQDPAMFAVMSLVLLNVLRRYRVRCFSVTLERLEEGLSAAVSASVSDAVYTGQSVEIDFCRTLSEQNYQIFSCLRSGMEVRSVICTVRKDYALLGVKNGTPEEEFGGDQPETIK